MFGHDDGLDEHLATRRQPLGAHLEEAIEVADADGFDHLDRHELVVGAGQVAIVLLQERDAGGRGRRRDPARRDIVLGRRDSGRRHVAAVVPGRVNRQRAPPGADFEQAVAWLQVQLAADAIDLQQGRLLERVVGPFEDAARVGHRVIEKEREEDRCRDRSADECCDGCRRAY